MLTRLIAIAHACAAALLLSCATGAARAETNVMFIFDASGSMKAAEGRQTRLDAAKAAMAKTLSAMPDTARLGLTLYGHRRAKDCGDIELVAPIGAEDSQSLSTRIAGLQAKGETPIAGALQHAVRSFAAFKGQNNRIVLVTDGIEECRGDPCAAARAVRDAGLDLKVDIVGFTLNAVQRKTIQCVTELTGGTYYEAQNAAGLTSALKEVTMVVAEAAPPPPPKSTALDLLAAANGGALLASPDDTWAKTVDGKEEYAWGLEGNSEAVYGFKDDRPATFDTLAVFVGKAEAHNPQTLELLAGDEGPTGQFRSIATCNFQNIKLMRSPFQECKFAPVTAKYLKVRIAASFKPNDARIYATEFKLFGKLEVASAATPVRAVAAASASTDVNLLAAAQGGSLLASPDDTWAKTVDGKDEYAWGLEGNAEAVYGFKDDRAATFNTLSVFIGKTEAHNPHTLEVLTSDDSPTGQFRAVATCNFQNIKLLRSPYQECKFDAVTAKYVKVRILASFKERDARVYATEFKLMGRLSAASAAPAAAAAPAARTPAARGIDLFAAREGGALLAAPDDTWAKTIDGKEEYAWGLEGNSEAVYGFKDDRAATFDTLAVFIGKTDAHNPQSVELLASDEGPTGQFRSVATCNFQNVKLVKNPYQECKFAPVTAKYVKVRIASSFKSGDARIYATEFKLLGQLK